ncbi:glycoside hydrolase family 32 protein [Paenibacillus donghaensis]|uniref:Sucrose-6-phosphate hydrolase n=1 Tax=Paenibacillus donghaensis TaxID=414771 RepID=A0A2Z2KQQ6_9BACL|nr:sucrose-6-phosphate hydrolase [Paenibacillus donghaensis]ASA21228.1 sucrose-6-phosphate hydrolase [Paenibacillus donghaensis]
MKMSRERLYRRLEEADPGEWEALKQLVEQSPWRQRYHIQPVAGLLNDPNGFSYFEGRYHLFYQWFPLGTQHGMKYWYHTVSSDLVRWENRGIAIAPDSPYDSHGVFSGSAIEKDGRLYLMFTGNTRSAEWIRQPYQCLAYMEPDGTISKHSTPVISEVPPGYTDHFRDPKVWKTGDSYYCVIGAQRSDKTGCALLYRSPDLLEWHFEGEMGTRLKDFGYMWECPDYFEMDGSALLLISPQGLEPEDDRFQNIYQSGYLIGLPIGFDDSKGFHHGEFHELDRGFDFYAPQTTLSPDGRRILTAWMGLPDIDYPTDSQGWAHCLCLPRELHLAEGRLIQRPARELVNLRGFESRKQLVVSHNTVSVDGFTGTSYELLVHIREEGASSFGIEFRVGDGEKTVIAYDRASGKATLDRSLSGQSVAQEFGTKRSCLVPLQNGILTLRLFVDVSSVEVFVNDGQEVFTARIFPDPASTGIHFFAEGGSAAFDASKWDIHNWGGYPR